MKEWCLRKEFVRHSERKGVQKKRKKNKRKRKEEKPAVYIKKIVKRETIEKYKNERKNKERMKENSYLWEIKKVIKINKVK